VRTEGAGVGAVGVDVGVATLAPEDIDDVVAAGRELATCAAPRVRLRYVIKCSIYNIYFCYRAPDFIVVLAHTDFIVVFWDILSHAQLEFLSPNAPVPY
jgi:hypothetical protein